MRRVPVSDHPFNAGLEIERWVLANLAVELVLARNGNEATLAELARESVALLVCYAAIPRTVVEAAHEGGCRIISAHGMGHDNIDLGAAAAAGIVVTNVPDRIDEVADHTLALLVAHARGVFRGALALRAGGWGPSARNPSASGRYALPCWPGTDRQTGRQTGVVFRSHRRGL